MTLTRHEEEILNEIHEWMEMNFSQTPADFTTTYDEWLEDTFSLLPEETQEKIYSQIDEWMFYIQASIGQSESFDNRIKAIVERARVYNEEVNSVNDLKRLPISQLNFIADQQRSVHNIYSLIQGGVTGFGNPLSLGMDLPLLTVINLRSVQLIAASYGYDPKHPFEMLLALKVFSCATLPKRFQGEAWDLLIQEVQSEKEAFFYEGTEKVVNTKSFSFIIVQILKGVAILLLKNKKKKLPIISMAIGASANYTLSKNVTEFAKRFYQYRYILEKRAEE